MFVSDFYRNVDDQQMTADFFLKIVRQLAQKNEKNFNFGFKVFNKPRDVITGLSHFLGYLQQPASALQKLRPASFELGIMAGIERQTQCQEYTICTAKRPIRRRLQ